MQPAEWDLKAAESSFANFQMQLKSSELAQSAELARLQSEYEYARANYETNLVLYKDGLIQQMKASTASG